MMRDALSAKHRLNTLFLVTAASMFSVGACGFVSPTSWSYLFDDGGAVAHRHIQGRLHLKETIRLFSAFLVGMSYVVFCARWAADAVVRAGVARGLLACSLLTTVVLVQAHQRAGGVYIQRTLSTGTHGMAVVGASALSSLAFAWFVFFQKPAAAYRGLPGVGGHVD